MKLSAILALALLCLCSLTQSSADIFVDFEKGVGSDDAVVGNAYSGLSFATLSYGAVRYADASTGLYNVSSDNGSSYGQGEYFISGKCAAYIQDFRYVVRIDVAGQTASYFKVGYSSDRPLTLRAFDADNAEVAAVTGQPNLKSLGGSGLAYLTASSSTSRISYVTLQASIPTSGDGFWLMDNIAVGVATPGP